MGDTRQTNDPPCAIHELRLGTVEKALGDLAETTRNLEKLANRAIGGFSILLVVQPVITGVLTGLILWWLTKKGH